MALLKSRLFQQVFSQLARGYATGGSALPTKNLCAVLYNKRELRMEERKVPEPRDNQLLIKIHTVGVCGSDAHLWRERAIGNIKVTKPAILGHEAAGTVASIGRDVHGFNIGDRVALEPLVPCRECMYCRTGRYNLCKDQCLSGVPPTNGFFAQYVTHDARFCYKLPDNLTMEDGALLEPLSVALHACRRANITAGSKVLVLGAGPIGLTSVLSAKAFGATHVCVTDVIDHRLEIARSIGADITINVKGKETTDVIKEICKNFGKAPEKVLECCGFPSSTELALKAIDSGGRVIMIALAQGVVPISVTDLVIREIDVCGVFGYTNCWPMAIDLVSSGVVDLKRLTRARYRLDDAQKAFEKSIKSEVVKVMVQCDNL